MNIAARSLAPVVVCFCDGVAAAVELSSSLDAELPSIVLCFNNTVQWQIHCKNLFDFFSRYIPGG
jgi:hypothetical protein